MTKPVKLSLIRNERRHAEARDIHGQMHRMASAHAKEHGDEIAGFALVSWSRAGDAKVSWANRVGPVGTARLPGFVADALRLDVARSSTVRTLTGDWPDDEGA